MAIEKLPLLPVTPTSETAGPIPPVQPAAIRCLPGHDPADRQEGYNLPRRELAGGSATGQTNRLNQGATRRANLQFQFRVGRLFIYIIYLFFIIIT